jgi:hypothetical protein
VNDLWLPNQQAWNTRLIDTIFQNPLADQIKNTTIICSQEADFLCWKPTPSEKCNSKLAYRACLQNMQEQGEPKPRQVHPDTQELLNQIWRNKALVPRIQTFGWRFLRRAMPTGARAGKYSKHISKLCCRCGTEEDDVHLFFTCAFSKAAWFSEPWFLRTEMIIAITDILAQIIKKF